MKILALVFLSGCAAQQSIPQAQYVAPYEPQDIGAEPQSFEPQSFEPQQATQTVIPTPVQPAVSAQDIVEARAEEARKKWETSREEGKRAALQEAIDCKQSAQCLADMVCHQVEEIEMWKRAIRDEMRNPSGVVSLARLHEYGASIQQNEYYVKQDLEGTKFTVAQLCKS